MCDERERLIGYVYEECDATERREIDAHLADCETCRAEIAGLRATRVDLLAWDVPPHQAIWRPFVAAPSAPAWRQVPAWALAAAASLIFAVGAAGGAAARVWWPAAPAASAPASAAVTPADLAALKASVLTEVRGEMEQRVSAVASHDAPRAVDASATVPRAALDGMAARLASIERWQNKQIELNVVFDQKIARVANRQTVSAQSEVNPQAMRQISLELGR